MEEQKTAVWKGKNTAVWKGKKRQEKEAQKSKKDRKKKHNFNIENSKKSGSKFLSFLIKKRTDTGPDGIQQNQRKPFRKRA